MGSIKTERDIMTFVTLQSPLWARIDKNRINGHRIIHYLTCEIVSEVSELSNE